MQFPFPLVKRLLDIERELDRDKKRLVIESILNTLTIIDRQALALISIDIDPLLYRDTVDKT
jgi:hypothetical protein